MAAPKGNQYWKHAKDMGRKSKYNEKHIEGTLEYLEIYEDLGDIVPTVAGLSIYLNVPKRTLYDWAAAEGREDFSHVFTKVQEMQEKKLVNGGLGGIFNPAITKMMMTKHGYSDKQEVDMSSKDGTMSPPTPTYVVVDE